MDLTVAIALGIADLYAWPGDRLDPLDLRMPGLAPEAVFPRKERER